MERVDTAPASQVEDTPPVFWMELPVTVTLTALVQTTASQPEEGVGVVVLVETLVGVLVGGMDVLVGGTGVLVAVRVRVLVGGTGVLVGGTEVLVGGTEVLVGGTG